MSKSAGFDNPKTNPLNSTSTGLKTVEGQITAINYEKRGLADKENEEPIDPAGVQDLLARQNENLKDLEELIRTEAGS